MRIHQALAALLLVSQCGCALLQNKPATTAAPPALQSARPVPVQANDITTANARSKLQQMQEEMDREAEILDKSAPSP